MAKTPEKKEESVTTPRNAPMFGIMASLDANVGRCYHLIKLTIDENGEVVGKADFGQAMPKYEAINQLKIAIGRELIAMESR